MQHITGKVWQQLSASYPSHQALFQSAFEHINEAYSGANRHYHNLEHLSQMLGLLEQVRDKVKDPDSMAFAIFFHDIIYKAGNNNNEEKSAEEAANFLEMLGYSAAGIRKVSEWIIATKTHGDTAVDSDLSYLLDIDLGILGTPLMSYVEYTRQIRQEYRIFPDLLYNPGRKKVLKHFLDMPFIYNTPEFRAQFEQQARENITWEMGTL
jgi:predicted metal-dependent HD superfamily phosphohydrolase